jgi:hypothetical protein
VKKIASAVCLLVCLLAYSCIPLPSAQQQAQDAQSVDACVLANWGEPVTTIALDCVANEMTVAEDIVADIEAAVESVTAKVSPEAVAHTRAAFPYRDDAKIVALVQVKLTQRAIRPADAGGQ